MTLQSAVEFEDYYRCYVVGQEKVRVMKYDPKQPHHLRYVKDGDAGSGTLQKRLAKDSVTLCKALGYDFNTVELAVQNSVPYAIDFLNPAPDADVHSVGQANFDWVVENMAQLAIDRATGKQPKIEYRWDYFLKAGSAKTSAASS